MPTASIATPSPHRIGSAVGIQPSFLLSPTRQQQTRLEFAVATLIAASLAFTRPSLLIRILRRILDSSWLFRPHLQSQRQHRYRLSTPTDIRKQLASFPTPLEPKVSRTLLAPLGIVTQLGDRSDLIRSVSISLPAFRRLRSLDLRSAALHRNRLTQLDRPARNSPLST